MPLVMDKNDMVKVFLDFCYQNEYFATLSSLEMESNVI